MLNQISELDYLLVPVGGGGLLAGCSIINNLLSKKTKVIGVESKFYPSLYNIFYNQKLECSGSTIAEGIAVKEIGSIPYSHIKDKIDSAISVSDTSIEQAIAMLALTEKGDTVKVRIQDIQPQRMYNVVGYDFVRWQDNRYYVPNYDYQYDYRYHDSRWRYHGNVHGTYGKITPNPNINNSPPIVIGSQTTGSGD